MKRPLPPPELSAIWPKVDPEKVFRALADPVVRTQPYLAWDDLRHRTPPAGLTLEEWWAVTCLSRQGMRRPLPLLDKDGKPFTYALPDEVLRAVDEVNRDASGQIAIDEQVTNPDTRDRYVVSSLIEEAVTSSQLEGASTTRRVAKEMIRTGREPRNRSELMILNNYRAMRRIVELKDERLTPDLICEIHRTVTDGTLADPDSAGRFQTSADERVVIEDERGNLLHRPPRADELPERVQRLCDFANGDADESYVPPILRAMAVHFMLGYDHPFEDGNGRTARLLFYWSCLKQGYWLTKFLSISNILKKAPAQYARSFLLTEVENGDLTHFFVYQLTVYRRAVQELHGYLGRKAKELAEVQRALIGTRGDFNYRQMALVKRALKTPGEQFTIRSHQTSHDVSFETARKDLMELEARGLLVRTKIGRRFVWGAAPDLRTRLGSPAGASGVVHD